MIINESTFYTTKKCSLIRRLVYKTERGKEDFLDNFRIKTSRTWRGEIILITVSESHWIFEWSGARNEWKYDINSNAEFNSKRKLFTQSHVRSGYRYLLSIELFYEASAVSQHRWVQFHMIQYIPIGYSLIWLLLSWETSFFDWTNPTDSMGNIFFLIEIFEFTIYYRYLDFVGKIIFIFRIVDTKKRWFLLQISWKAALNIGCKQSQRYWNRSRTKFIGWLNEL